MNQDSLENLLREKLPVATPRPGLETRIRALANPVPAPGGSPRFSRLVLPTLAILTLSAILLIPIFIPREQAARDAPVASKPDSPASSQPIQGPVSREYEGLKKDALWTMSLVRNTVPSLPVSIKKTDR